MSLDLTLGASARRVTLRLTRGFDFVASLATSDGSTFSATAVVTVEAGTGADAVSWAATGAGTSTLRWNVDKALVNALVDSLADESNPTWALRYVDGATELPWALGPVVTSGA